MDRTFAVGIGRLDLRPIRVDVAPEGRPPLLIQVFQAGITLFKPFSEGRGAKVAVAGSRVFIRDVPGDQRGMSVVAFSQLARYLRRETSIVWR